MSAASEHPGLKVQRGEATSEYQKNPTIWWDVIHEGDGKPVHPIVAGFDRKRDASFAAELLAESGADWTSSREEIMASPRAYAVVATLTGFAMRRRGTTRIRPDTSSITLAHFHAQHAIRTPL
jgi:hypothetical protein